MANLLRFALLLFLASAAQAEWAVTGSETERSAVSGVEHRRIVVSDPETGEEAKLDLALFSTKSATLRVIDNPTGADDLAAVIRRTRAVAGANGGYFDPQDVPLGLLISDGKLIAPLRKARLLSGVMVVTKGRVELLRYAEYSSKKNATAALQCGPFLVDGGKAVPGLNDTRSARRTFILTGGDRAAIAFCSSVTLAELGEILATPGIVADLKVQRALNLDGGSSSAFWFTGENGPFSIRELKRVRNFVVVVPK
ncbi:MAG TPA: phosphodiester glycosidase family protein [Chthoniobacterales bacterium]|nr:phosphodiester glycosidase family protein [Chthoniobacterales bacterium]